jgi:hypothetical protein
MKLLKSRFFLHFSPCWWEAPDPYKQLRIWILNTDSSIWHLALFVQAGEEEGGRREADIPQIYQACSSYSEPSILSSDGPGNFWVDCT